MNHRLVWLAAVCCLLVPGIAGAFEYGIGPRIGTQGLGVEGAIGFTDWFSLRGGLYGGSLSRDFEEGGNDYESDLTVGGAGVLADFFPMRGKFRLTTGLFSNANEIEFNSTPNGPIEIGGTTYNPVDVGRIDGKVEFDSSAPYFGVGWGNLAKGRRLGFLFDAGFLAQGSPEVSLRRSSTTPVVGFDQDLQREADEIERDIEDFDFWPVISFGMAVRF